MAAPVTRPQQDYQGTNRLLLGMCLAVSTFWLFGGALTAGVPDMIADLSLSSQTATTAVSLMSLFCGLFIVACGKAANAHVVGADTGFEVSFATGGTPSAAKLVYSYPADDLAVIKVDGPLPVGPATFGDSSKLTVEQLVLAMGSPLGLSGSVSSGIVSAVGRTESEPRTETSTGTTITDMIQTSSRATRPG